MSTLKYPFDNYQVQSPLFGVLPGEIRNEIFALALMQHEDKDAIYPEDSYWSRPGFRAPHKSNSVLLRTCKAAYAEGQKVFLKELERAFWFDRGPKGRSGYTSCVRFFTRLAHESGAVEALQKVRFFTQMYWLENGQNLHRLFRVPQIRPTQITITIRYSDWWWWEDDAPLTMEAKWLQNFLGSPGLRELNVEYETRLPKKAEMMRIVERNKKYKLPIRREGDMTLNDWEGYLSAEHTALQEWTFRGTSKLGGQEWSHLAKSDTVEYVVVTDTWKFVDAQVTAEDLDRQVLGEDYLRLYDIRPVHEDSPYVEVHSPPSPVYSDEEYEDEEGMYSGEEEDHDVDGDESDQARFERSVYMDSVASYEYEFDWYEETVASIQRAEQASPDTRTGSIFEQGCRDFGWI